MKNFVNLWFKKHLTGHHGFIKKIAIKQTRFNHPSIDEGQKVAIEDLEWAKRIYNSFN